jgi:hypoxanthine phosphoribosyltransferase
MPSNPKILIGREEIDSALERLSSEIRKDYEGRNPLLIGVLKGSFILMADLVRKLHMPSEVDFVCLSSYGGKTESSGKIRVMTRLTGPIRDRDVIVVEDIIDTGLTTAYFMSYLARKKPASLRLFALTEKPSRRKTDVKIDYLGFSVPDKFIVGYGIDWDQKYRYLPDICYIE